MRFASRHRFAIFASLVVAQSCGPHNPTAPRTFDHPSSTTSVSIASGPFELKATLARPVGEGPFRAIVYNHGSAAAPSYKEQREIGEFFQRHGIITLFPYRRGSSGSEGVHWEKRVEHVPANGRFAAIVRAIEEDNDDVIASIEWLRKLPDVDPRRVAVAGCSFGGIQALLTAERTKSAYAAIDFAGASMSWANSQELQDRLKAAAAHAQVPVFLLQAENDFNTTPTRELARVMAHVGKPHRVKIYPPHGLTPQEGHHGFCFSGTKEWGDDVLAFLDALKP